MYQMTQTLRTPPNQVTCEAHALVSVKTNERPRRQTECGGPNGNTRLAGSAYSATRISADSLCRAGRTPQYTRGNCPRTRSRSP